MRRVIYSLRYLRSGVNVLTEGCLAWQMTPTFWRLCALGQIQCVVVFVVLTVFSPWVEERGGKTMSASHPKTTGLWKDTRVRPIWVLKAADNLYVLSLNWMFSSWLHSFHGKRACSFELTCRSNPGVQNHPQKSTTSHLYTVQRARSLKCSHAQISQCLLLAIEHQRVHKDELAL